MHVESTPQSDQIHIIINEFFFFFSSRRRHTRFDCDWSSDVCSSDLAGRDGYAIHAFATEHGGGSVGYSLRERSEEHTSELQSQSNLVCRLLLEKKPSPTFPEPASTHRDHSHHASQTSPPDDRQSATS